MVTFPSASTVVALVFAAIGAFRVGPLQCFAGLDPRASYGLVGIVALGMVRLSAVVTRRRPRQSATPAHRLEAPQSGG
ncbi:MAG: hypothetical protein JO023_15485 [Chloroflexi bacterium]|nr:hypothetical protein [Chloroflexota bacterium]